MRSADRNKRDKHIYFEIIFLKKIRLIRVLAISLSKRGQNILSALAKYPKMFRFPLLQDKVNLIIDKIKYNTLTEFAIGVMNKK